MTSNINPDCCEVSLDPEVSTWLNNFVRLFSHDFKNRISAIHLSAYLLERHTPDAHHAAIEDLREQLRDLNQLVEAMQSGVTPCQPSEEQGNSQGKITAG